MPKDLPPYTPELTVLDNGVSLLNAPSSSRNSGVFLIVRAGSRDETAQTSGLAHYLEHMFFKGTERRPTTKIISREIDRLGANTNAYTDTEEVAYFAEGPAMAMLQLADIICDMLTFGFYGANVREGLMLGKPVICYLRPEWLESIRREQPDFVAELPVVSATPDTVEAILTELVMDPEKRLELGRRGREFAVKWYSGKNAAAVFDKIYGELISGGA
jgi:glycosyltransferase involved in cell wall biosynthesis